MAGRLASMQLIDSLYETYGVVPIATLIISLTVCATILLSYIVGRIMRKQLVGTPIGELSLLTNIIRAVIIVGAVFFLGQNVFHIEMGGLVQAFGITTLVVSLGLQDLIKSVVAGILIVVGDIVSQGDQVIMGEHRGEVMDINWHQISIRDRDGIMHIIPNSKIVGDTFMRVTGKMAARHMFECDIVPGVDLMMVKTDIEMLAATTLTKNGWIAEGYAPQVMFMGSTALGTRASIRIFISDIEFAVRSMDAVMCEISRRGYLADCTHEAYFNATPSWTQPITQDTSS